MNTENWQVTAEIVSPNFGDVADQSREERLAYETWVNLAVEMLNRGESEQQILAQLAHDGCPDPETVLLRAQQQPEEDQPTEEDLAGVSEPPQQDIFTPEDEAPRMAKFIPDPAPSERVRVAGLTGTVLSRYEDSGQPMVHITMDHGDLIIVPESEVEAVSEPLVPQSVSEIQQFIDSFPEVNEFSVNAHIANWRQVKTACEIKIADAQDDSERVSLEKIHQAATQKITELTDVERRSAANDQYLDELPRYEVKMAAEASRFTGGKDAGGDGWLVHEAAQAEANIDTKKAIVEGSAIIVSEMNRTVLEDKDLVHQIALTHLGRMVGNPDSATLNAYGERVERHRLARLQSLNETVEPTTTKTASVDLPDLPDDALFL